MSISTTTIRIEHEADDMSHINSSSTKRRKPMDAVEPKVKLKVKLMDSVDHEPTRDALTKTHKEITYLQFFFAYEDSLSP